MPQPTLNQVHANRPLTNIAVAYWNANAANYVASRIFPRVPVSFMSDLYYVWKKGDWFRGGAKKRAPATESEGGGQTLETATYLAHLYALHDDLADQILKNADPQLDLRGAKTRWLQQQMLITREQGWVTNFFTSGIWGTDATGFDLWDDFVNSDPADQIETAKLSIQRTTGLKPNKMVVGQEVHSKLKFHPLIAERYKYTSAESITEQLLAQYFEVDEYMVASAIQNTGVEGGSDSFSFIVGKHAWLGYVTPNAAMNVPTAGYQFDWTEYGTTGAGAVSSFRMENLKAERIEIEKAWADKVVGADLGYFWPNVVA